MTGNFKFCLGIFRTSSKVKSLDLVSNVLDTYADKTFIPLQWRNWALIFNLYWQNIMDWPNQILKRPDLEKAKWNKHQQMRYIMKSEYMLLLSNAHYKLKTFFLWGLYLAHRRILCQQHVVWYLLIASTYLLEARIFHILNTPNHSNAKQSF